jgi:hypothetical protein
MSYVLYDGDSRSDWERLNWLSLQIDQAHKAPVPERKIEYIEIENIPESVFNYELPKGMDAGIQQAEGHHTIEWARIGYVIIVGLFIAVVGVTLRFIVAGPFPFAFAAFGMAFVVAALYHGAKLDGQERAV